MRNVTANRRGSVMTEFMLASPLVLAGMALLIWWAMLCTGKLRATYALFMANRAASVQLNPDRRDRAARQEATAVWDRSIFWNTLDGAGRVAHVRQPLGHAETTGDNPIHE